MEFFARFERVFVLINLWPGALGKEYVGVTTSLIFFLGLEGKWLNGDQQLYRQEL